MNGHMDRKVKGWMVKCMGRWVESERVDRWKDGWKDGWVDGW